MVTLEINTPMGAINSAEIDKSKEEVLELLDSICSPFIDKESLSGMDLVTTSGSLVFVPAEVLKNSVIAIKDA